MVEVQQIFNIFDRDRDGFISPTDLHFTLLHICKYSDLENDEVSKMISIADGDKDGKISFNDFQKFYNELLFPQHLPQDAPSKSVSSDNISHSPKISNNSNQNLSPPGIPPPPPPPPPPSSLQPTKKFAISPKPKDTKKEMIMAKPDELLREIRAGIKLRKVSRIEKKEETQIEKVVLKKVSNDNKPKREPEKPTNYLHSAMMKMMEDVETFTPKQEKEYDDW